MKNKLFFLTKMSLNKKIKTKWFLIANLLFAILIIGLINIDSIIKFFGGDFNNPTEILLIDQANIYDSFKNNYEALSKYIEDYDDVIITKYEDTFDKGKELVEEKDKILLEVTPDEDNYLKARIVSKEGLGTITSTLINTSLSSVRSKIVLNEYNITNEMYQHINMPVSVESITLSDNNLDDNMTVSTIMQILTIPIFMLIIFLVQMIGAEVNEEKTTKSMEIIISNVSPKTHFLSKIIAANVFVLIQSTLLITFVAIGIGIRYIICDGNILMGLDSEVSQLSSMISISSITRALSYMIPIMLIMFILTFIAYSLLAGILASMTTNQEDFQQLQTPIVIVSLVGYYLSIMSGLFKGSLFIKIMSYIPLISAILTPSLYVMGEITIYDLIGSILVLIAFIYILIKYGLRIYKVGILNYSQTNLWKKMFKAVKEK